MEKKMTLNQISKGSPFRVPDGYFESLTSRVMVSIDDAEKSSIVVGMLPRKKPYTWAKWLAAAACVGGAFFFLGKLSETGAPADTQLANVSRPSTSQPSAIGTTPNETTVEKSLNSNRKTYSNDAYVISSHSTAASAPSNKAEATSSKPIVSPSGLMANNNVKPKSTSRQVIRPVSTSSKSTSSHRGSDTESTSKTSQDIMNETASSSNDIYLNEYDMLDYTDMSSVDVYDYLAGNEYY